MPSGCPDRILLDYPSWCLLGQQIERLYSIVPKERVLNLLLDDIKEYPRQEYLKALDFLQVPDDKRQEFPVHNAAREWKLRKPAKIVQMIRSKAHQLRKAIGVESLGLKWLADLYEVLNETLNVRKRPRLPMPSHLHEELIDFFAEDVLRLERLLNRDLSMWLKKSGNHHEQEA